MQTIKQIVKKSWVGLFVIPMLAASVAFLSTTESLALNCSVLPQDICNTAENPASGGNVQGTGVFELLKYVLWILTAGVGIVAVGAVVYAGILYASAGDNQQQVQQAKTAIKNTVIGIVAFALMSLVLNWLIPGGVFN